jgi:SPP1 gp7 family putative phage head morphogenesis protein
LGFKYAGLILPLDILAEGKEINFQKNIADSVARKIFKGKKVDFDTKVWGYEYKNMLDGIETGWGKGFRVKFGEKDYEYIQNLKYNTAVFDAFKCNKQIKEAYKLLVDDSGSPLSWKEFLKASRRLSEEYNGRYLKAEYNTAHSSAKSARKWQEFVADEDLYPNLEYVAVMDGATRPAHAALNGVIKPINDDFWNKYYPPNGWGCRCRAKQTDKDPSGKVTNLPDVPEALAQNCGKTAQIFNESHEYYKNITEKEKANALYFVQQNIRSSKDVLKKNQEFNSYGNEYGKSYFNSDNGGYTVIHKKHNRKSGHFSEEEEACNICAAKGMSSLLLDEPGNKRQFDGIIGGVKSEIKVAEGSRNMLRRANQAVAQGAERLIYYVKFDDDATLFKKLKSVSDTHPSLKEIWYIKNKKLCFYK